VIAISLLSACVIRRAGSPQQHSLDGKSYRVVWGRSTDIAIRLFGLIPVSGSNTTQEALDAAIRASAVTLIDITVEYYAQYWIVFTRHVTAVRGMAIKFE
jgi:hypothetical protein